MAQPDPFYVYRVPTDRGSDTQVTCVEFAPDDARLLVGTTDGTVSIYNLDTHRAVQRLEISAQKDAILATVCLPNGALVVQARESGVSQWRQKSNGPFEREWTLPVPTLAFCRAAVRNPHWIALARGHEPGARLYDLTTQRPRRQALEPPEKPLKSQRMGELLSLLAGPADAQGEGLLLAGFENGEVVGWAVGANVDDGGAVILRLALGNEPEALFALAANHSFTQVAAVTSGRTAYIFDPASESNPTAIDIRQPGAGSAAFRPDGRLLLLGGWDAKGRLFRTRDDATGAPRPLALLRFHESSVQAVAFSHGAPTRANWLALGSADGAVSLWALY